MEERGLRAPATSDDEDGTVGTTVSCQGGAVVASWAPAGRVSTAETMYLLQAGAVGAVGAYSVSAGRSKIDWVEASSFNTEHENGYDPSTVLSVTAADELSSWKRSPATVWDRTQRQRQRLEVQPAGCQPRIRPEIADAWTKSKSMLNSISGMTQDALTLMNGAPAAENE